VSKLYEYCQAYKLEKPIFHESRTGTPQSMYFICEVHFTGIGICGRSTTLAKTKKEAKEEAAKIAYFNVTL